MAGVPFQIAQNNIKSLTNPARITAIGGDNGTEFYLYFPDMLPGSQWIFPFIYGFMYVVDSPSYRAVHIDASQTPPGAQVAPVSSKVAQLVAYDGDQVFNPGISSPTAGSQRWNINNAPTTGAAASVTRAASSGVTHVADMFDFMATQTAATAATGLNPQLVDGASTLMFNGLMGLPVTVGLMAQIDKGPGANLRGGPGNGLTIRFLAGATGINEAVNLSGYDQ